MEGTYIALRISDDELEGFNASRNASDPNGITDLIESIRADNGCDLVCIPLTNSLWKSRWSEMCLTTGENRVSSRDAALEQQAELWRAGGAPLRLAEVNVQKIEQSAHVIALASDWICLDSDDEWVRHDSELALLQEINWAAYLNLAVLILPAPHQRGHIASFARAVNAGLNNLGASPLQLSVQMPIYDPHAKPIASSLAPAELLGLCWEMWDTIRSVCDYNPKLSLTLDLSLFAGVPHPDASLGRWAGEPVRYVMLSANSFVANPKGYPVLSKHMQQFIRGIVKFHPTFILSRVHDKIHTAGGSQAYVQYIHHLERTSPAIVAQKTPGTLANFTLGWGDYLQAPLQPLMDNLGSGTYDVFERCPIKYKRYEEAIYLAISDRPSVPNVNIYVVGAGRGPLVECSLRALNKAKRKGKVWAIEKNPGAWITLQELCRKWGDTVALLFGDMRSVPTPPDNNKALILVSELLGSFGDNELSPECLDGAMRFLRSDGVSIPCAYTALLAPLTSSKLYNEVRVHDGSIKDAETPYVVALHAFDLLSGQGGGPRGVCGEKIQVCWEFEHSAKEESVDIFSTAKTNSHNVRSATLNFSIPQGGILHGLAGYFESVLYGDVRITTHPDRMDKISPNMTSWFPLLFPIHHPLYLPANAELHVSIWRLTDKHRVWYEWFAESFLPVPLEPILSSYAPRAPSPGPSLLDTPTRLASPLLDPASPLWFPPPLKQTPRQSLDDFKKSALSLVKIGQTALHNPNGRSSWIGF